MSTVLDFPPIADAPAAQLPAVAAVTLKSAALAHFNALEAPLRALAERYRAVAFDVSTPKGLDAAKKARNDLRENGRYAVQRAEDAFKAAANEAKKAVAPKVEELVAIIKPIEDSVHAQIVAREEQLAAEKAERDRIEAERVQKHRDALALIESYVGKAQGLPSDRIAAGLVYVQGLAVGADVFEEFAERAAETKAVTIERLQAMQEKALADEEAARQAEALRAENARQAAELAALRAEKEAREQAERAAEDARVAALAEQRRQDAAAESARIASQNIEARAPQQVLKAEPATADATDRDAPVDASPRVGAMGLGQAADAAAAGVDTRPPIKLGDVCARLGFTITAAFVTDTLGIQPVGKDKAAVLFAAADYSRICDALVDHITTKKGSH